MKRPWMQFHTRDWLDNKELRRCSAEARGILADLMSLAHEGAPYGYLSDRVGPLTDEYMASRCFVSPEQFRRCIDELLSHQRIHRDERGCLFLERMVRDEDTRQKRAAGGSLGGNRTLQRKVNLPSQDFVTEEGLPRSDSDSDSDSPSQIETVSGKPENHATEIISLSRFDEWWELWSKVRGTPNKCEAVRAWLSVVTEDLESACFECTESYLQSLVDPRKGFNPENFLFRQAKDAFQARWPRARDSPPKLDFVQSVERVMRERIAQGRAPL